MTVVLTNYVVKSEELACATFKVTGLADSDSIRERMAHKLSNWFARYWKIYSRPYGLEVRIESTDLSFSYLYNVYWLLTEISEGVPDIHETRFKIEEIKSDGTRASFAVKPFGLHPLWFSMSVETFVKIANSEVPVYADFEAELGCGFRFKNFVFEESG